MGDLHDFIKHCSDFQTMLFQGDNAKIWPTTGRPDYDDGLWHSPSLASCNRSSMYITIEDNHLNCSFQGEGGRPDPNPHRHPCQPNPACGGRFSPPWCSTTRHNCLPGQFHFSLLWESALDSRVFSFQVETWPGEGAMLASKAEENCKVTNCRRSSKYICRSSQV